MESDHVVVGQCNRCGLHDAKGLQTVYDDGAIDFKCDVCGQTSRLGYTETSQLKQVENKRERLKAEENRSRYQQEKMTQIGKYLKENAVDDPDDFAARAIGTILSPSFMPKGDSSDADISYYPV